MMPVDIVVRAYNDMPVIEETLRGIRRQRQPGRILVMDNESQDGTTDVAKELADRVINVPAGTYVPGTVLNQAMEATVSEYVVFLNSDCTPLDDQWLETLLAGFDAEDVVAVFSRQMPRPDCLTLFAKDTDDTFGDGAQQANWKHCFSMASSAIRRSTWQAMPFNPDIQYSEDIEWTWRARQQGGVIRYCPESRVYHSHNYTLKQWYRRQYGEGKADAEIFDWPAWDRSWPRYSALPFVRQVLSDWKYALARGAIGAVFHSPALRLAQMLGRRKGFNAGFQD
jgi:rhamnosyltransferase